MKKYIIKIELNKDKKVEFYNVYGDIEKAGSVHKIGNDNIADQAFYESEDKKYQSIFLVNGGILTDYGMDQVIQNNVTIEYSK
jgi:tRNA splicing endonuclease